MGSPEEGSDGAAGILARRQPRRYWFTSDFNLAAPRKQVQEVLVDLDLTKLNRSLDLLEVSIDGPIRGWAKLETGGQASEASAAS